LKYFLAVPSLHVKPLQTSKETRARQLRLQERERKEIIDNILQKEEIENKPSTSTGHLSEVELTLPTLEEKYSKLLQNYEELKCKHAQLQQNFRDQNRDIVKKDKAADSLKAKLEQEVTNKNQLEEALGRVFTAAQRDLLTKKKKKVIWSSDDISRAFTLRYLSRRAYIYVRKTLQYPLPHIATLKKWAAKLNFRQGILQDVLRFMKIAGMKLSNFEKVTVLNFDEMKVHSTHEFDKIRDEIIGPHSQMQVVMVRGLFSNWKQPMYVDFDQKMTQNILFDIIVELEKIGYHVVACVSDCGGGNVGLWSSLDISIDKTSFNNPVTEEKVFIFPDAPHILKLVRNWLLDTGFIMTDGSEVNKKPLESLLQVVDSEVSSCHRLTKKHLECVKSERQNVPLAMQLLSHTVATCLIQYQPGSSKELAEQTGKFIEQVSTWFSIMNSYSVTHSEHVRKPYGIFLENQNNSLNGIYETFKSMKCHGKNVLQTFQKALLMSVKSLQQLFIEMRAKYDCKYILTHRVNQNCIENFFSQVRNMGGLHDHPSPLQSIYRIRLIVLGKNPGVIQDRQNTDSSQEVLEEYLVANVISGAELEISENEVVNNIDPYHEIDDPTTRSESSLSSTSTRESKGSFDTVSEADGFKYLCGFIARKFKEKYPDMGIYTKDIISDHSYSHPPDWLQFLSFGGLTVPSHKWLKEARIIEKYFKKYHAERQWNYKKISEYCFKKT
jgi:hypothetical protein